MTENRWKVAARSLAKQSVLSAARQRRRVMRAESPGTLDGSGIKLVCIGAQRAGTTLLFDVMMAGAGGGESIKELHALDVARPIDRRGLPSADYLRGHAALAAQQHGIDFTPAYAASPVSLASLAQDADVHLLMLLRDPLDRARSALQYHVQRYGSLDARIVDEAVHKSDYPRTISMLDKLGLYDRTRFVQFERLITNPQAEAAEIARWAGIPFAPATSDIRAPRQNASHGSAEYFLDGPFVKVLDAFRRETLTLLPALDPTLWPEATA